MAHRDRPGDAATASELPACLLGVLRRTVRERRAAGSHRRARARRRAEPPHATGRRVGDAARDGLRTSRLRPGRHDRPDRVRCRDGAHPRLGGYEPDRGRRRRSGLVHCCSVERALPPRHASRGGSRRRTQGDPARTLRPRRDAPPWRGRRGVLLPGPRMDLPAVRGLHVDARVRHRRAATGGGARPRADERRDAVPVVAGERRPRAGGRRPPAVALLRRREGQGDRVRVWPAGDRGFGRRRCRADLPRARGTVARDAQGHARRGTGGGAGR